CEQVSIRFADAAITCTEQMRERFAERGARKEKIGVILNSFDDQRFDPRRYSAVKRDRGHFVLVFHGTIDDMYGLDLVVRAIARLRHRIPGLLLRIYGDGPRRESIEVLAKELGVEDLVWFSRAWVPMDELLPRIAEADIGVVAIRRDACFDLTHSNKMYDLIAMQKPVVTSRTRAVEAYFGDECFQLFESGIRPTGPPTACVLARHPEVLERFAAPGAEIPVHGLVHGDHAAIDRQRQRDTIARAMELFARAGLEPMGFRGPYLRCNQATLEVLRELGFRYHSSQAVHFPLRSDATRGYELALELYSAIAARDVAV